MKLQNIGKLSSVNDLILKHVLTGKDVTHLRKDGSQAEVHAQARGFLSTLHQDVCTLIGFSHSEFDFCTFIFFVGSDFDFSISCDAEDLSWRRDVSEGIVAGRWVSWLFCRLNTCDVNLD